MKESVVEARHRRLAFVVQNASCRYERVAKADAARAKRSWGRRLLALESTQDIPLHPFAMFSLIFIKSLK